MPIDYVVKDGIAHITLRNGSVNPITPLMHHELHDALIEFLADPHARVGVLSGAGTRAFSAGDDLLSEVSATAPSAELSSDLAGAHRRPGADPAAWGWSNDNLALERYKPIVGAVSGWCLGAGLVYLLALTDIRVASADAQFGFPEINYGMAGAGAITRLGRYLPHTAAMSMLLTGDPIDAAEARRIHLVNEVVSPEDVRSRAVQIATRIAGHPPLAVRIEMEAYTRGMDMSRADALAVGDRLYQLQRLALGETEADSYRRARDEQ